MRHTWVKYFIIGSCSMNFLFAADDDTTKIYKANDIVVTATRIAVAVEDAPAPVQVVTSESLQNLGGKTVADALALVNGASVFDYGAAGGMKTISIRGLSAANVAILLDGNPINDPQNGLVDLSLLPLSFVDRIEFVSGGASSFYGGNASGGVVNIITRKAGDGLHARVLQEIGSFNDSRTAAEVRGGVGGGGMIAGYSHETGSDNFPFVVHRTGAADTALKRSDADYDRKTLYWSENLADFDASIQYVKFDRGVPGEVDSVSSNNSVRENDEVFHSTFGSRWVLSPACVLKVKSAYDNGNETYTDPNSMTDLYYQSKGGDIGTQLEWTCAETNRLIGGAEYDEHTLHAAGLSWGSNFILDAARLRQSVFLSDDYTIHAGLAWLSQAILYAADRYDKYSDVGTDAFSPKIGVNVCINTTYDVHLRSSWSKNFRVPTFNDLYYPGYSNPALNPERSNAFDIGLSAAAGQSDRHSFQATYYDIEVQDGIVSDAPDYIPYNIASATHRGVEVRYDYRSWDDGISAYAGGSYGISLDKSSPASPTYDKQLPYVPKFTGLAGIAVQTSLFRIDIHELLMGLRYTDALETNLLPSYALTDIVLNKSAVVSSFSFSLQLAVKNVFDKEYQIYQVFPMPGRSFKISLGVEY